ncbi:hypothetical protein Droror1_Dr00023980 [Drosera rotundifolia]
MTIQPDGLLESLGYATGGIHEVAAGEQPSKQPSADHMIVMMEELLRIRRKAEELIERDTEKYFQRLNAYLPKRFIEDDDPMVLENWFGNMEKHYKAVGYPEKLRPFYGYINYLEGEANNWWTSVAERADLPNFDWEQLKELIHDRYYLESLRDQMREEFSSLEYDDMNVTEYTTRFTTLL